MSARTMRPGLFAAALTVLAGCPCPPSTAGAQRVWNFEATLCSGMGPLCGFEAQAGSAQIVTAFTPGEHAMQIASESRMASSVHASVPAGGSFGFGPQISLVARCDPGTTLEVDQTVSETFAASDGGLATPALITLTANLAPGSDWGQANTTMPLPTSTSHPLTSATVVEVTLVTHGPGTCTVDDLVLRNGSNFCD